MVARACLCITHCWSEEATILQGCRKMPGTSSQNVGSLVCLSAMDVKTTTSTACHRWNLHAGSCQSACASINVDVCPAFKQHASHHALTCLCDACPPPSVRGVTDSPAKLHLQVIQRSVRISEVTADKSEEKVLVDTAHSQRLWTYQEISLLSQVCGLEVLDTYGDLDMKVDMHHMEAYRTVLVLQHSAEKQQQE